MSSTTWETLPERPEEPSRSPQAPDPETEQHWMPWTAPLALVTALVLAFLGGILCVVAYAAVSGSFESDNQPPGVLMAATFLQDGAFIAVAVGFARMTGRTWAGQFGLRRTRVLSAIGWIVAVYFAYGVVSAIYQQFVKIEQDKNLLDDLGTKNTTAALILSMVLVCVVAPIAEEFFFRGFFFAALRNWRGFWPAALLTGLLFGAIHVGSSPAQALPALAILGFALCGLRELTGSLYPCIVLHALNNAIAFGTLNDWGWQIPVLFLGALAVIALLVLPVAARWRRPAGYLGAGPAPAA